MSVRISGPSLSYSCYWYYFQFGITKYFKSTLRCSVETPYLTQLALFKEIISFFLWRYNPERAMASSYLRFLDHTQRRTTAGRSPTDDWLVRRWDLYLTTHNIRVTNILATVGIRTLNPRKRGTADSGVKPHDLWDRLCEIIHCVFLKITLFHQPWIVWVWGVLCLQHATSVSCRLTNIETLL